MKKKLSRKVTPVTPSNGKQFSQSLDALFRARTPVDVHDVLRTCLNRANTLTLIRALYSWVVTPHGLSVCDLSQSEFVHTQVMNRWQDMVECELVRIRRSDKLMSDWTVWRALHELSPAATDQGKYIQNIWDSFYSSGTLCARAPRIYYDRCGMGDPDFYPLVHDEVLAHPSRSQVMEQVGIAA